MRKVRSRPQGWVRTVANAPSTAQRAGVRRANCWPRSPPRRSARSRQRLGYLLPRCTTYANAYGPVWDALLEAKGLEPERFLARKGQALIWVSTILHGGDRQLNKEKTRWSQVTHYFFEDCAYYTPFFSDPFHGGILYREPTDVCTGEPMRNVVGFQSP